MYCANDPINKYDPTGHFPWLIFAATMLFTPVGGTITQAAVSTIAYVSAAVWASKNLDLVLISASLINRGEGSVLYAKSATDQHFHKIQ